MKLIPIKCRHYGAGPGSVHALVDDVDFERVSKHSWNLHGGTYARTRMKGKWVLMHRFILQLPDGIHTDHKNGLGLDNQRQNIRPCNRSQNMCNRKMHKNNTSGLKGVRRRKGQRGWEARIQINKTPVHLGFFTSKIHARIAYDAAARVLHGEFARPNK